MDTKPPANYKSPLINYVKPNKTELGLYDKLELNVVMSAQFDNPFDPEQITLDARIKGPDGKAFTVPGFYYQEYQRNLRNNKEELAKFMEAGWKIRFTPKQTGKYTYYVIVQDKYRIVRSDTQEFNVVSSKNKGFIRTSKSNPYYLQTDNGDPYFAIGHNVCWTSTGGTYEYDKYFDKMSAAGENYTRLWMINWSLGLEFPEKLDPGFGGLGRYHLGNAYKLDYILEQAEKKGIYLMLCFDSFSNLKNSGDLGMFKDYPYSANQLGPCATPQDFFTNEQAKKYYKKKLRYLIARYGYSTHVLAWEFWNEVDLTDNYNSANVTKWHQEMARFVRENDPHQHLITTSFSGSAGDDNVWNLPEIDIVQTHLYNILDAVESVRTWCLQKYEKFHKPHIFGEYGLDAGGKTEIAETSGMYLHTGNWTAAMSHSAGTPMSWWWDNYIDPNNLYHVYSGLAKFTQNIQWTRDKYEPLKATSPKYITPPQQENFTDAVLWATGGWGDKTNSPELHVTSNGVLQSGESFNTYLHGTTKLDLVTPHKFLVDYPADGKFLVHVQQVSKHGILKIKVDGIEVFSHTFTPASGAGEWKEEKYIKDYDVYQNIYDKDYGIDIRRGKHTIEISNEGTDWILISAITLTNYLSSNVPNLTILGYQTPINAFFWVQNKNSTWYNKSKNISVPTVKKSIFEISGLTNGHFKLEWYDTEDSKILSTWTLNNSGTLKISIPDIQTDLAAKLEWIGE